MSKVKNILVHGCGGTPTINYIRSLKLTNEKYNFIGIDCNKFNILRSEADKNYLMPFSDNTEYHSLYFNIVEKENIDFIHSQIDQELSFLSKNREKLPLFLPSDETIKICQDKFHSYQIWKEAGIKVPKTILIKDNNDLRLAFHELGPKLWIREISGSAGKNSIPTESFILAKEWIDRFNGWGKFTASECLLPETVTWMSIWHEGELIVAQTRKRLYWESGNRSPSGVTGITGTGVTFSDKRVDEIALQSIYALEKKPHGIHSIDMTFDEKGIPNPTENNIGRFFTTHLFFAEAGCNFASIYTKIGLGEGIPIIKNKINPLPDGIAWIRGMDIVPILTDLEKIKNCENELQSRTKALSIKE